MTWNEGGKTKMSMNSFFCSWLYYSWYWKLVKTGTKKAIPKNTDLRMVQCLRVVETGFLVSPQRKTLSSCVRVGFIVWYRTGVSVGRISGAVGGVPGAGWEIVFWADKGKFLSNGQGWETVTVEEHGVHTCYLLCIQRRQIQIDKAFATLEHATHTHNITSIQRSQI